MVMTERIIILAVYFCAESPRYLQAMLSPSKCVARTAYAALTGCFVDIKVLRHLIASESYRMYYWYRVLFGNSGVLHELAFIETDYLDGILTWKMFSGWPF